MDRRHFLATATAASALPLAGCSRAGLSRIELRPVGQETESRETHLLFGQDGRELLTFTVRHGRAWSGDRIPMRLSAWHADGTHLDSFRIVVRAPADSSRPITEVYLKSPWYDSGPELDFHTGDDADSTILAVDDLAGLGDGTLTLELLLDPAEMPETLPVRVSAEFEFAENGILGREYRAEGATTVEVEPEP